MDASVLSHFPPGVQYACAYGSGVFEQPGLYGEDSSDEKPMVDLIFAVDDPVSWHREIDWMAERVGAEVYFNTLVPWKHYHVPHGPLMIKYGVMRAASLRRDLTEWHRLYVAGRLHKPVLTLHSPDAPTATALELNLESALRVALLILPERFSEAELLNTLCSLSYHGDIRQGVAEDASKVERIVSGSYEHLIQLYAPAIGTAEGEWGVLQRRQETGSPPLLKPRALVEWASAALRGAEPSPQYEQDGSAMARAPLLAALPAGLLSATAKVVGRPMPVEALADPAARATLAAQLASYSGCGEALRRSMAAAVRASSWRQAVAGVAAAGVVKSVTYAWKKVKKAGHFGSGSNGATEAMVRGL